MFVVFVWEWWGRVRGDWVGRFVGRQFSCLTSGGGRGTPRLGISCNVSGGFLCNTNISVSSILVGGSSVGFIFRIFASCISSSCLGSFGRATGRFGASVVMCLVSPGCFTSLPASRF